MTHGGTCFLGIVALASFVTTACSGTPTSPTAVIQAPGVGANLSPNPASGSSGSERSMAAGGAAATGEADLQVSGWRSATPPRSRTAARPPPQRRSPTTSLTGPGMSPLP